VWVARNPLGTQEPRNPGTQEPRKKKKKANARSFEREVGSLGSQKSQKSQKSGRLFVASHSP